MSSRGIICQSCPWLWLHGAAQQWLETPGLASHSAAQAARSGPRNSLTAAVTEQLGYSPLELAHSVQSLPCYTVFCVTSMLCTIELKKGCCQRSPHCPHRCLKMTACASVGTCRHSEETEDAQYFSRTWNIMQKSNIKIIDSILTFKVVNIC